MTCVLVPVAVLEGGGVSPGLMDLLGTVDVTVLGYHVLPEQTPPDQARLQFEERATDALEDLGEEFRAAGGAADHRLVFTHDRQQSIDRIADEIGARAVAISGMTGDVDSILVSLSGEVSVDPIVEFVVELIGDRNIDVTLLAAGADEVVASDRLGPPARRLRAAGLTVETMVVPDGTPVDALVDAAPGHDAIVMGQNAPSIVSAVLGDDADRVASGSVGPVLVVRDEPALDA